MGDISKNYGGDQNLGLYNKAPLASDKRFPIGYMWIDTSVSPRKSYTLVGIVGGLAQWSASGSGAGTGSGLSEYLPGTTYLSGDIVNYHGILYKCVAVSTIGEQPDLHPAVWELYNRKVNFTSITDPSKGVSATMLLPIKTHIDSVGHGLVAGTKVRFAGADLPAPLAELTDYTVCLAPGADWFEVEIIALNPIQFTTAGSGDYMVVSSGACTMTGATDLVNAAAHPMLDGDIVQFTGVDLPVELALLTDYYVINANVNDFQISLLPGGAPVEFSDSGAGMDVAFHQKTSTPIAFTTTLINSKIHKVATTMVNDDPVQFTGLLLPPELVAGTTYYVVNKSADDFEVAPGLGGVPIDFSLAGSGKYHLMNQALTTAILDAYDGIIITLTEAPAVAQTLQVPTIPDKVFIVVNSKTSTHSITVFDDLDSIVIEPGSGVKYFWDGTSWNVLEGVDAKDVTFTPYGIITEGDVQGAVEHIIDVMNKSLLIPVRNETGAPIAKGAPVYPLGVSGGKVLVGLASAADKDKCTLVGLAQDAIADSSDGLVLKFGDLTGVNTAAFGASNLVYLGNTPGTFTDVRPTGSSFIVVIGAVKVADAVNGSIVVDVNVSDMAVEVLQDTGWSPNNMPQMAFVDTDADPALARCLNLTPVVPGGEFKFYQAGEQYSKTADSIQIPDEEGLYLIYYSAGVLSYVKNPVNGTITTIMLNNPLVAYIYWNVTDSKHEFLGYKLHKIGMNCVTRAYLHDVLKTRYISGIAPTDVISDGAGDNNAHAQFGFSEGKIVDEDNYFTISTLLKTTGMPVAYLSGAELTPVLRTAVNAGYSFLNDVSGLVAYNTVAGGNWVLSPVTDGKFVCCHIIATNANDPAKRLVAFVGQRQYDTLKTARDGAQVELMGLRSITTFPQEIKAIATFVIQTSLAYTNDVNARVRSIDSVDGIDFVDFRNIQIEGDTELVMQSHFPDNKFEVYDSDDATRTMSLDLSQITTGTNRKMYMPDRDVDFNAIVVPTAISLSSETKVADSFLDTLWKAVRWDVIVSNVAGTVIRCFSINAAWLVATDVIGDTGEYGIVSVGDSSDVSFTVTIVANTVTLSAVAASANWLVSTKRYPIG